MEDVTRETPKIYALFNNHQTDYKSTMVEVDVKIAKQSIYVLIDPGSSHSSVTLKVVANCSLEKRKHSKPWLIQLTIGTKTKVSEVLMECPIELNGLLTKVDLNILPLGSYDSLICMDWFKNHRTKLN